MSKNKKVQAELSIKTKEYEDGLKRASKTTQNESKKMEQSNKNNSNIAQTSSNKIKLANNAVAQSYGTLRTTTTGALESVRNSMNSTASNTTSASNTIANATRSAGQSFNSMANQASQAGQTASGAMGNAGNGASNASGVISNAMNAISNAFQNVANNAEAVKEKIKEVGEGMKEAGEKVTQVGDKMTKTFTAPVTAIGTGALAVSSSYEYAFAKVSTLLDESEVDLQAYKKELAKTAGEMGVNLSDYAEAVYQAMSAGQSYGDAINFVRKNVELAKGGFTDTTTAVNTTTTIMNTYGKKAGDLALISDKLIATQNKGKTSVGELGGALAGVIPKANSLSLSFDELLGSMAHLTAKGIPTAQAGTMLTAMLDELGKSGTKSSDVLKNKTGKSFKELMDSGKSLLDVLKLLEKEAKASGIAVSDLFGSSLAGSVAINILDYTEDYLSSVEAIKNGAGSTESAYGKMADTIKEKMAVAMASIQESMATLGDKLSPIMDTIIEVLQKVPDLLNGIDFEGAIKPFMNVLIALGEKLLALIDWYSKLDPSVQNFIAQTIMMGAVLGPIISFIGKIITSVGLLMIALSGPLGTALSGIATFITGTMIPAIGGFISAIGGIVVSFAPWILGIMAVVGAGYLLWKNWEDICAFGEIVWQRLCEGWDELTGNLSRDFERIKNDANEKFDNMMKSLSDGLDNFKRVWSESWEQLKSNLAGNFEAMKQRSNEIFDNLVGGIKDKLDSAKRTVQEAVEKIKSFFNFEWSLPKIKVPKFNIVGKFDLIPPDISVPTIDISWHADGGIFTKPTLFNTPGGMHGVGEAGAEAILPLKKLPDLLGLDKKGSGDIVFNFYDTQVNGYKDVEQLSKELGILVRRRTV